MTEPKDYALGVYEGLKYLAAHGKNKDGESTRVVLPGVLSMTSLIQNESILNKKINYYGTQTTCSEARKRFFSPPDSVDSEEKTNDPRYQLFSQLMPLNPVLYCPTLFSVGPKDEEKISLLANRVRAFREELQNIAKRFNEEQVKNQSHKSRLNVEYLTDTESLTFEAEDVGADCFHLSKQGQEKVAETISRSLKI